METIATGLQELSLDNDELSLSIHKVESSDDMLNKILLKLPVTSLVLFKSVCKRWLSLIKDATFIKRRSPKIDPPSGLLNQHRFWPRPYGSVSFDIRIPLRDEKIFETMEFYTNTSLQSCNGLFLCSLRGQNIRVYNPTLNLIKVLPEPHDYDYRPYNLTRIAFDPTKSPHYKVVYAARIGAYCWRGGDSYRIQTYSSETGIWSTVCIFNIASTCSGANDTFPCYENFENGIYWDDGIHWIDKNERFMHYKLDFVNKTVVLSKIQLPVTKKKSCKLFESRGCLILLGMNKKSPHDQLNVYEMRKGDSKWTFKYSVNDRMITSYGDDCIEEVLCIAMGEREEDSFMVIKLGKEVILYKFVTKTFRGIPELQPNLLKRRADIDSYLFIASFASV